MVREGVDKFRRSRLLPGMEDSVAKVRVELALVVGGVCEWDGDNRSKTIGAPCYLGSRP